MVKKVALDGSTAEYVEIFLLANLLTSQIFDLFWGLGGRGCIVVQMF